MNLLSACQGAPENGRRLEGCPDGLRTYEPRTDLPIHWKKVLLLSWFLKFHLNVIGLSKRFTCPDGTSHDGVDLFHVVVTCCNSIWLILGFNRDGSEKSFQGCYFRFIVFTETCPFEWKWALEKYHVQIWLFIQFPFQVSDGSSGPFQRFFPCFHFHVCR